MNEWLDLKGHILLEIGIIAIATTLFAVMVRKIGDKLLKRLSRHDELDLTNYRFFQHILTALIIIVGSGLIIFMIPGLKHVAKTLITGAGILAIIVGFASQQALSNVVGGIFIVIFKPYRIGDIITIKDTLAGTVEDISLRHTVIRNFENKRIIIPNSFISNEVVVNSNFSDSLICKWINFSISYTSNIDKAREIVREEAMKHPLYRDNRSEEEKVNGDPSVKVRVLELGEYSINMRAWVWASYPSDAFVMGCDVLESIKKRFDAEGIEIPYPYRNLIVKNPENKPGSTLSD